ncbi:DUF421 domain-containing protein [Paenibacillus gansuensis]|uniref:DUF421 domain-containing protein n=1 Tax=Paenibacillus gansuensis TaxID=306542 RepID=A0ABW5P8B5_9BACL
MAEWLEVILRTAISVIVLFFLTKLLGKRQVSQLSLFEYITGITIGSLAAYISMDLQTNWYLGLISLAVWISFSLVIEYIQLKNKKLRDWIDGKGTILIENNKILENNLKKEKLTLDDLTEQLRKKNVFSAAEVEFAIMETTGDINVLLKKENQPVTPKQLGIKVPDGQASQAVIMDGEIIDKALSSVGLTRKWLHEELDKHGVRIEDVFLAQVSPGGEVYFDLYNDRGKVPVHSNKQALLSSLQACKTELERLTMTDKHSAKMTETHARQLENIIQEVKALH